MLIVAIVFTCVGIFAAYAYSYKTIYIINPNCLYINIYMTFTLIIYIDLPNFVDVTMYCYIISYICSFTTCKRTLYNVSKPNMCPSLNVLTHTGEARADLTAKARVGHMCGLYHVTRALPHSWLS